MDVSKILKDNDLKITKPRLDLLCIIDNKDEVTIKDIQDNISIDKSTIYRIIDLFLEKGIVEKKVNYNNEVCYEIKKHKHYIKCIKCHKKEIIDFCPIDGLKKSGFEIVDHRMEVDGICDKCRKV